MAEQATSTRSDPAAKGDSRTSDKEEVLRLRDLLITKDAELGVLRGRVAELEAGTARLLNFAARVRSRVPSFLWSAGAGLRKRRRPRG